MGTVTHERPSFTGGNITLPNRRSWRPRENPNVARYAKRAPRKAMAPFVSMPTSITAF